MWYFKENWTDNCSDELHVYKVSQVKEDGYCNTWTITKKFAIADECGNTAYCEVSHSGGDGGDLIGECPDDVTDLQCLDEVPGNAEVIQLFKEAYENESMVRIWTKEQNGDDCDGFEVRFKVMINDDCGNTEQCWITFSGKDETAPVITSELPNLIIGCEESPTFEAPDAEDNCGGEVIVKQIGEDLIIEGDCEASFSVVRTWIATDACGNVSEPISQMITVPEECCEPPVCAYTPFYWGQNVDSGSPNVKEVLEANGDSIEVGGFRLGLHCIDAILPGAPLATPEGLIEAGCPAGLFSSSLIRHTTTLTLNTLNDPALCEVLLQDLPCPIDLAFFGYDETSTVCDLLADANEALAEEWFDCELADALAAVNECLDCTICVPAETESDEEVRAREEGPSNHSTFIRKDLDQSQEGLNMEVFPNPSAGMVNLHYAGFGQEKVWIYVRNINGNLVHQAQIEEGGAAQLTLDMGSLRLPGGTYVITASSKEATLSRKVIINYQR